MSRGSENNLERFRAFGEAFRELSTVTVFFHSAIAARLGLTLTEHKAFEIIARKGRVTAGELSELTGLTTGAITGIVDRLEKAGFVRRGKDPNDRRRVIIRPHPDGGDQFEPLFESLEREISKLHTRYTDHELAVILGYLTKGTAILQREGIKLRLNAQDLK